MLRSAEFKEVEITSSYPTVSPLPRKRNMRNAFDDEPPEEELDHFSSLSRRSRYQTSTGARSLIDDLTKPEARVRDLEQTHFYDNLSRLQKELDEVFGVPANTTIGNKMVCLAYYYNDTKDANLALGVAKKYDPDAQRSDFQCETGDRKIEILVSTSRLKMAMGTKRRDLMFSQAIILGCILCFLLFLVFH